MSEEASSVTLILRGINGWVHGESFDIPQGVTVVGRSRTCDISLRRCHGYRRQNPSTRDQDHDFNTVSRQHVKCTVDGDQLTLEDVSTNGTYCDDSPIEGTFSLPITPDLKVILRLGTRESFMLCHASQVQGESRGPLSDSTNHTGPADSAT